MTISIGIDVAEARKGLDLVALDTDRAIVAQLSRATLEEVVSLTMRLRPAVVCIDSSPAWAQSGRSREAERALRRLGITAFSTPVHPGDHPFYGWMKAGFAIFDALASQYPRYRSGPVAQTAVEVFPEASAVLLQGHLRPSATSKPRFRRDVLAAHGVHAEQLGSLDAVDAALGALTGLFALQGEFSGLGTPDEGVIVVPTSNLPHGPLTRPESDGVAAPRPTRQRTPPGPADSPCLCGCGALVRRRFLPGHDAKLKSLLNRAAANGDTAAVQRLLELGWLEPEKAERPTSQSSNTIT